MLNSYLSKDKFGFYQVGEFKTYSKVEAIELSNKTGKKLHWNFNDEEFASYNWKVEPVESLQTLYRKRARQIRERYDYIVLWYSGGADSYTMLRAFLDEGLFIDEIATFHNYGGDGSWDTYLNSEVKRVAMPVMEKVLEQSPLTKFRLVDHADYQDRNLYNKDDNRFDFIYRANAVFSPNQLTRQYIRETDPDFQKLFAQGKSVCFVWGMDKPRLNMTDKTDRRYSIKFIDIVDNSVSPYTQRMNRPWENDEFFFWSPDSKDMLCKQGHVIMRYLKNVPPEDIEPWFVKKGTNSLGNTIINGKIHYLSNEGLHRLIYPDWVVGTYSSGKHDFLLMWSPRDEWYLKDTHAEHTKTYVAGLKKLEEIAGPDWTNLGGITRGLSVCISNPYYLE